MRRGWARSPAKSRSGRLTQNASQTESIGNQLRLFALMDGERADGGAGARVAACVDNFAAEKRPQTRLHETPRAHVLRFLLAPDEFRALRKRLHHLAQLRLGQRIKLFNSDDGRVSDLLRLPVIEQ